MSTNQGQFLAISRRLPRSLRKIPMEAVTYIRELIWTADPVNTRICMMAGNDIDFEISSDSDSYLSEDGETHELHVSVLAYQYKPKKKQKAPESMNHWMIRCLLVAFNQRVHDQWVGTTDWSVFVLFHAYYLQII